MLSKAKTVVDYLHNQGAAPFDRASEEGAEADAVIRVA
jgi:hypothetical protein